MGDPKGKVDSDVDGENDWMNAGGPGQGYGSRRHSYEEPYPIPSSGSGHFYPFHQPPSYPSHYHPGSYYPWGPYDPYHHRYPPSSWYGPKPQAENQPDDDKDDPKLSNPNPPIMTTSPPGQIPAPLVASATSKGLREPGTAQGFGGISPYPQPTRLPNDMRIPYYPYHPHYHPLWPYPSQSSWNSPPHHLHPIPSLPPEFPEPLTTTTTTPNKEKEKSLKDLESPNLPEISTFPPLPSIWPPSPNLRPSNTPPFSQLEEAKNLSVSNRRSSIPIDISRSVHNSPRSDVASTSGRPPTPATVTHPPLSWPPGSRSRFRRSSAPPISTTTTMSNDALRHRSSLMKMTTDNIQQTSSSGKGTSGVQVGGKWNSRRRWSQPFQASPTSKEEKRTSDNHRNVTSAASNRRRGVSISIPALTTGSIFSLPRQTLKRSASQSQIKRNVNWFGLSGNNREKDKIDKKVWEMCPCPGCSKSETEGFCNNVTNRTGRILTKAKASREKKQADSSNNREVMDPDEADETTNGLLIQRGSDAVDANPQIGFRKPSRPLWPSSTYPKAERPVSLNHPPVGTEVATSNRSTATGTTIDSASKTLPPKPYHRRRQPTPPPSSIPKVKTTTTTHIEPLIHSQSQPQPQQSQPRLEQRTESNQSRTSKAQEQRKLPASPSVVETQGQFNSQEYSHLVDLASEAEAWIFLVLEGIRSVPTTTTSTATTSPITGDMSILNNNGTLKNHSFSPGSFASRPVRAGIEKRKKPIWIEGKDQRDDNRSTLEKSCNEAGKAARDLRRGLRNLATVERSREMAVKGME